MLGVVLGVMLHVACEDGFERVVRNRRAEGVARGPTAACEREGEG